MSLDAPRSPTFRGAGLRFGVVAARFNQTLVDGLLARAQAAHADVVFAFANQGESAAEVEDFLRRQPFALRNVLRDDGSRLMVEAGSRGLPTTLFFDARGRLADTHMGELTEAGLAQKLQRLGSR